jgi:hypothetical protein
MASFLLSFDDANISQLKAFASKHELVPEESVILMRQKLKEYCQTNDLLFAVDITDSLPKASTENQIKLREKFELFFENVPAQVVKIISNAKEKGPHLKVDFQLNFEKFGFGSAKGQWTGYSHWLNGRKLIKGQEIVVRVGFKNEAHYQSEIKLFSEKIKSNFGASSDLHAKANIYVFHVYFY